MKGVPQQARKGKDRLSVDEKRKALSLFGALQDEAANIFFALDVTVINQ